MLPECTSSSLQVASRGLLRREEATYDILRTLPRHDVKVLPGESCEVLQAYVVIHRNLYLGVGGLEQNLFRSQRPTFICLFITAVTSVWGKRQQRVMQTCEADREQDQTLKPLT